MLEIPLQGGAANAHQEFTVTLGDFTLGFNIYYVNRSGQWGTDITIDDILTVTGAMLEPGADIIEHYHLPVGRLIFSGDKPTLDNLGSNNRLVWVEPDD